MRLEGAGDSPALCGENKLDTPTSYLIGKDPAKWHTASNYERVRIESVYPGIDMLYHGKQRALEYDFELAPGADPGRIALRYDGVRRMRVASDGSLVSQLRGGGELRQKKPIAYQMIKGERREVASRYRVKGKQTAAFELGDYDTSEMLVIDPQLVSYSTYLGGNDSDLGQAIAVDAQGIVYVTGQTASTNFPTLHQYQMDQLLIDVFVTKIDPTLSGAASLLYSTYLGGTGADFGFGIAVDANGNVFVTGETSSTDFPIFNEYQTDRSGTDAFVTEINTNASGAASVLYSTYLGGNGFDSASAISIGSAGNVFVTGKTDSTNFPTLNQYQSDQPGSDAFVTKINPSAVGAASLLYSTYLGGADDDFGTGIAAGSGGNVVVTGQTDSTNFPTLNQYQSDQGIADGFVTKLDTGASGAASLLYSTYLGGSGSDTPLAIAVDAGKAYVTGYTFSSNFPTLNQYQGNQPITDVFVTKLDTGLIGAASLLYSTYLGGGGAEAGNAIAVNGTGVVFVTGYTASTDFPTLDPVQTDQPLDDAFVAKLDTTLSGAASLLFSTYLGGDGTDRGNGIAVHSGDIFVTGETDSTNLPTFHQYQTHQASNDAFVTKFIETFNLLSAVSRKTHGATAFDINLPLTTPFGVECRSGGPGLAHTLIFTFDKNVVSGDAQILSGGGFVDGPPSFSGATMTVRLGDVDDIQTMTLNLSNVTAAGSGVIPTIDIIINFLLGDTSGNKSVNATDVSQTKLQSGVAISATNFRNDINVNGTINATDVSQVKLNTGHGVP